MAQYIDTGGDLMPRRGLPPAEMPHGLLAVPDWVRETIAREKAKHFPDGANAEWEQRLLCDWTLQHYFEAEGYEVLYRRTPVGPDVVAVGFEEIYAFRRGKSLDDQLRYTTWMP